MSNVKPKGESTHSKAAGAELHALPGKQHAASSADFQFSDAVAPAQMGKDLVEDAVKKDKYQTIPLLTKGFLCTPFLAYATALCALLAAQGLPTSVAGLVFPVGYIMLATLGLEMATGCFSVVTMGVYAGRVKPYRMMRNWALTFLGNFAGGLFFAWLLWFSLTKGGSVAPSGVLTQLVHMAEHKSSYREYGALGWCAAVTMGILCNWLVSLAPIMAKAARSVPGRVMLMWLPLGTFFALGFEHTVVNMFIFPTAILSGANISVYDWWVWNQIPVTIGNIIGAVVFNATLWFFTQRVKPEKEHLAASY